MGQLRNSAHGIGHRPVGALVKCMALNWRQASACRLPSRTQRHRPEHHSGRGNGDLPSAKRARPELGASASNLSLSGAYTALARK
jgi:hypothetical protein